MAILDGISPGRMTEGRNGRFSQQGKSALANTISTKNPQGYSVLSQMADRVKKKRGAKRSTITRKLGRSVEDKETREILKQPAYRAAMCQHLDVAIHYENGDTDKVYMAISQAVLKI